MKLGGGFKYLLCSPLFGEDLPFWLIFFRWVETTSHWYRIIWYLGAHYWHCQLPYQPLPPTNPGRAFFVWRQLPKPPVRWVSPNSVLDPSKLVRVILGGDLRGQGWRKFPTNPPTLKRLCFFLQASMFQVFLLLIFGGVHPKKLDVWALPCLAGTNWGRSTELGLSNLFRCRELPQHILVALLCILWNKV